MRSAVGWVRGEASGCASDLQYCVFLLPIEGGRRMVSRANHPRGVHLPVSGCRVLVYCTDTGPSEQTVRHVAITP